VMMSSCCGLYCVSLLASALLLAPSSLCRRRRRAVPSSDCVLAFVVRYYSSSACGAWCVALNVVAVLTSRLGWNDADVERLAAWLHVWSWSVPAALTVMLVVRHDIQLDVVLGLCRVRHVTVTVTALVVCLVLTVTLMTASRSRRDAAAAAQRSSRLVSGATLAGVTVTVIYECMAAARNHSTPAAAAAAAAASVVYPPLVSVVTAASIMWSSWRSRLMTCNGDRDAIITRRTDHDLYLPHQHFHHQHQDQLMRHSITCHHSCHTHPHQQRHAAKQRSSLQE